MKTLLQILLIAILPISIFAQPDPCYSLVWADEFDGNSLDPTKWTYQNGGWNGSNVQNCYTPNNTTVSGGTLQITAAYEPGHQCFNSTTDFTSGFVQTKDVASWTYGYFEARVKVPASNSTWPAFWMSPQDDIYGPWPQSGEIDIFEIKGHDMTTSYGNAHWGNSPADRQQEKGPYNVVDANNWHTYAVEWNEGELKFYIDGNHYHTINNFDEPNATVHPGPFNIPFYLRLNVAVGGDYLDVPHNDANNNINQLPATMEVDYVRVYQLEPNCVINEVGCELLKNYDFTDIQSEWSLVNFNGATGTTSSGIHGGIKVSTTNVGTSDWHLGLRQLGYELINGQAYEVNFKAHADADRAINVIVQNNNGTQYHYHGQQLTTSPTNYNFTFVMNDATDLNAGISLNSGAADIPVYYDYVSIVPTNCVATAPCELIKNKHFDNVLDHWNLVNFNAAVGIMSINNDGFLKVEVNTPGTSNWHLGVRQNGLLLEEGETYQVSYDAYADQVRSTNVIIHKSDGTQYYYHPQNLTTTPTTYTFQFTMPAATDSNGRIIFNSGATAINCYYDNISVTPIGCDPCSAILEINDQNINPNTYHTSQFIYSNSDVNNPDKVIFRSDEISLEPGFEVIEGACFDAVIDPCGGN